MTFFPKYSPLSHFVLIDLGNAYRKRLLEWFLGVYALLDLEGPNNSSHGSIFLNFVQHDGGAPGFGAGYQMRRVTNAVRW